MAFISGSYTATYKPAGGVAAPVGDTEDGFELTEEFSEEEIRSDAGGDTILDAIDRGGGTTIRFTGIEYDKFRDAMFPNGSQGDHKANVGKLKSALAGELVLTPKAGSPAAAEDGVWTFPMVYVLGNVSLMLNSRLRRGPITFRALTDTTTGKAYTVTAGTTA